MSSTVSSAINNSAAGIQAIAQADNKEKASNQTNNNGTMTIISNDLDWQIYQVRRVDENCYEQPTLSLFSLTNQMYAIQKTMFDEIAATLNKSFDDIQSVKTRLDELAKLSPESLKKVEPTTIPSAAPGVLNSKAPTDLTNKLPLNLPSNSGDTANTAKAPGLTPSKPTVAKIPTLKSGTSDVTKMRSITSRPAVAAKPSSLTSRTTAAASRTNAAMKNSSATSRTASASKNGVAVKSPSVTAKPTAVKSYVAAIRSSPTAISTKSPKGKALSPKGAKTTSPKGIIATSPAIDPKISYAMSICSDAMFNIQLDTIVNDQKKLHLDKTYNIQSTVPNIPMPLPPFPNNNQLVAAKK